MPEEPILSSQEYRAENPIEEMVALAWARNREYRRTTAFGMTPESQNWYMVTIAELTRVSAEDKKQAQQYIQDLQEYRAELITRLPSLEGDPPAAPFDRFIAFNAYTEFSALDLQRVTFGGDTETAHKELQELYDFLDNQPEAFLREPTEVNEQNYRIHVADFGGMIAQNILYVCQNNVLQQVLHQDGNYFSYIAERVEYAVDTRTLSPEVLAQLRQALYSLSQNQLPQNDDQDYAGRLQGDIYTHFRERLAAEDPRFKMIQMTRYIHREPSAVTTFGTIKKTVPQFKIERQYLENQQQLGRRKRKEYA